MERMSKIGLALVMLLLSSALTGVRAQAQQHPDRPPAKPSQAAPQPRSAPPQPHAQNPNPKKPGGYPPVNQNYQHPQNAPQGQNGVNPNARNGSGAVFSPRQQVGVGAARPWVDRMRDLSPQQRDRVMQNSQAFRNLSPDKQNKIRQQFNQWDRMSPQQQASLRQNEDTWRRLTPEQRDHIKNDVLPKWRQMPWDRQQVLRQKLSVLQNMPESARNQRLNDPNFTRGMTEDEKNTLHDLSHLHVGGAPEAPVDQ
jgi:hypothetical protein